MPKPVYVRVKDPSTGHEFDVLENSLLLRQGRVERVKQKQYPPSAVRRLSKHHLKLAPSGVPDVAASAGDETTTTEE
ncbi:hypothetical protein GCM10027059_25820 [Myceligenerans halotolerans]